MPDPNQPLAPTPPVTEHPIGGDGNLPTGIPVAPTPIPPQQVLPPQVPETAIPQTQPLTPEQRKALEVKAKNLITEIEKTHPKPAPVTPPPPSGPVKKRKPLAAALTVLALFLLVGGGFVGIKMLGIPGSQDTRQQAAVRCRDYDGTNQATCTGADACCRWQSSDQTCRVREGCSGGGEPTCEDVPGYEEGTVCWCANATSCGGWTCMTQSYLARPCKEMSSGASCWQKGDVCVEIGMDICSGNKCIKLGTTPPSGGNGECCLKPVYYDNPDDPNACREPVTSFDGQCKVVICPYGDTNGDQACGGGDDGYRYEPGTVSCSQGVGALGGQCGQVDPVDTNGDYCKTKSNAGHYGKVLDPEICPPRPDRPDEPTNTPVPGVTTPPTPTPTIPQVLACTTIGYSDTNPEFGDTVTLTCTGNPNARVNRAEYQVSVENGAWVSVPVNSDNKTANLTISQIGNYRVRCRVCEDNTDGSVCTAWQ